MPRQPIFDTSNSGKPEISGDGNSGETRSPVDPANGAIDPASIATETAGSGTDSGSGSGSSGDGSRPKRKYRKRNSAAQSGETLSVEGLAGMLYSCHTMLSVISRTPELMLDESEAKQLAQASVNVSRHYGFTPSSKAVDWSNLIMCLGAVYGTRLIAVRNRKRGERATRKTETPQAQPMEAPIEWPPYPNDATHNVN